MLPCDDPVVLTVRIKFPRMTCWVWYLMGGLLFRRKSKDPPSRNISKARKMPMIQLRRRHHGGLGPENGA